MLARKYRLHTAREIRAVFRGGRKIDGKFFPAWLSLRHESSIATPVVSRAVDKRAVARNLLKRRVREVLRVILPRLPRGAHVIIRPKPESKNLSLKDIKNTLCDLFRIS